MTVMTRICRAATKGGPALGLSAATSVRTPCGARRVENVRPGDLIVTRDNGLRPVRMVWTRQVTEADIAADPSLAPVRLKPRAIGPMMPRRDLLLGGEHRILVPGYRLADQPDDASYLIRARDVAEASDDAFVNKIAAEMTFYNLVFDEHQVFCADGLPVESYLPVSAELGRLDDTVSQTLAEIFSPETGDEHVFPAPRYRVPEAQDYRPEFV